MGRMDSVLKDIDRYFGFLYERGYKIRSADYYPHDNRNWIVVFESQACVIHITSDREAIVIDFGPVFLEREYRNRIGINAMIYYISKGQHFVSIFEGNLFWNKRKQFEELERLLRDYIDRIEPYFRNEFEKYKDELISTQNKYNNLAIERFRQKKKKNQNI